MKMNNYILFLLVGEAGTGKDTILQKVVSSAPELFHEIVSYTTRPPREGEVDGVNYHFISGDKFAEMIYNGDMLEASVFNDWCYGTGKSSLVEDKINIGVFNPEGVNSILEMPFAETTTICVFRICTSDKQRLIRQLNRENNPNIEEIFRRYKTDKEDFDDLDFTYIKVVNEEKDDLPDIVDQIIQKARILYSF